MTVTPAGWYPDPQNAAQLRYWDGQAWTESTSPVAQPDPAAQMPPAAPIPPAGTTEVPPYGDASQGYATQYPSSYPTYPTGQPGMPSPYAQPQENPSNTLSIIGIVCGAIAFLFCPPLFGIAGLILGGVAMGKKERLAKWALIVSGLGLVVGIIIGIALNASLYGS